jgi:hypothetical protein
MLLAGACRRNRGFDWEPRTVNRQLGSGPENNEIAK